MSEQLIAILIETFGPGLAAWFRGIKIGGGRVPTEAEVIAECEIHTLELVGKGKAILAAHPGS